MFVHHYDQKITENKSYIWYVSSKGNFYKILKSEKRKIILNGYMKNDDWCIKIRNKTFLAKHLVAMTFLKKYYPGVCIELIDNNPKNVNVFNLKLYSYRTHGKRTGYKSRSFPILISYSDGSSFKYRSVREASKKLNCSYQTLLDYLNGKVKNSVLNNINRNITYERG